MPGAVTLTLEDLHELAVRVLAASNTSLENATAVAQALVAAEGDGIASHGLSRLPFYSDQALSGKVDGRAVPVAIDSAAALVVIDARFGFAFPAIDLGLKHGMQRASAEGAAAIAIRNSHHAGVGGYHVERMAEQGFVALGFTNTPGAMAPWGGFKATFGTNPIAFACPRESAPPLVVDLSLSRVARGKIMQANRQGVSIPADWARDENGQPTTDPQAALQGTMEPLGEAKGAALALVVEILCAALTGSHFGYEASSFFEADGPPPGIGQLFLLLRPEGLAGDGFVGRVETLLSYILTQEGARLPGSRRLGQRLIAQRDGVSISHSLYQDLIGRAGV